MKAEVIAVYGANNRLRNPLRADCHPPLRCAEQLGRGKAKDNCKDPKARCFFMRSAVVVGSRSVCSAPKGRFPYRLCRLISKTRSCRGELCSPAKDCKANNSCEATLSFHFPNNGGFAIRCGTGKPVPYGASDGKTKRQRRRGKRQRQRPFGAE